MSDREDERHSLVAVSRTTRKEVKINDYMDYRGISAECDPGPYLCGVFRRSRVGQVCDRKRRFNSE